MNLHSDFAKLVEFFVTHAGLIKCALTLAAAFALQWFLRKALKYLHQYTKQTPRLWDDTLCFAIGAPLSSWIWIFAVFKALGYVSIYGNDMVSPVHWERFYLTLSIAIFLWFFWRYITSLEQRLLTVAATNKKIDSTTVAIAGRFSRIGLLMLGMLIFLEALGIPLAGLLAFGGGGAIILGIAAQQLLSNFFGGLMIFLDKPFKLGDWIQSPDRNIEGAVTLIGWRTTKVITLDHRAMYIPNALFNQVVIINPQRMLHRRIDMTFGLRYADADRIQNLLHDLNQMLQQHPQIDQRELCMIHLVNFGASSLDINVYCFMYATRSPDWRDVQQDIFFRIIQSVKKHGADFAFPTVTTHIPHGLHLLHKTEK